ncbi:caspase domain-containing protein [Russula dissimulans]|nr:caspase domain-containing protein [Russula dissimulans]
MSFSESSKYQDPLHILLDHIAERSSDCDMVLVHDNDLQKITGIGDNTSLETLQPDVMVDLLRRSDLEIHNVSCDLSHTSSSPNPGSNVVRVAMLSMIFQNGDSSPVPVPVVRNGNVISSFATAKDALRIAGIPLADAPPLGHPMATHRMRGIKSLTITPHDTPVQQPPFDRNHHCPPHNGSTHSSYGAYDWGLCSAMPEPQRGIGYDAFMRQPPLGRSLVSASARSYNVPGSRYLHPLDHAHQQNPAAVIARGSQYQGLVSSQNTAGGSYLTSRQIVVSSETSPPMAEYSDPWGLPPYERFWKPEQPMPTPQSFSLCTRKKRALVIGINYTHSNPDLQLRHAVEDAYSIANFLCENLGFAQDDVRLMTDDRPWDQPDKESIMRAMNELVYDAQPHDSLFCYFSGHGSQTKDVTGVELDGLSESMCAVDYVGGEQWQGRNANTSGFIVGDIKVPTGYGYETDGPIAYLGGEHVQDRNVNAPGLILDDLIHDLMVRPLPSRCRLTVVSDSCHSGTLLDLPYIYDSNGGVKELGHPYRRQRSSHADIVSLSVGHDHRESFETNLGGALRSAFIDCMGRCRNGVTYKQLMESIQNHAKGYKFPQEPQLSSSLKLDTNRLFFI